MGAEYGGGAKTTRFVYSSFLYDVSPPDIN